MKLKGRDLSLPILTPDSDPRRKTEYGARTEKIQIFLHVSLQDAQ
jgi:hypothetical protein